MRPLRDVLRESGVDPRGWEFHTPEGVSGDGRTFIGDGIRPAVQPTRIDRNVPEPAPGGRCVGAAGLAAAPQRHGFQAQKRATCGAGLLRGVQIMTRSGLGLSLMIIVCLCAASPGAAIARSALALHGVDFRPTDVSSDGSVVVGSRFQEGYPTAVWTSSTGTRSIGVLPPFWASEASGVSADGSVVVGVSHGRHSRHV
jgi:hypothetical protein